MNIKRWLTGIGVIAFLSLSTMIIADQADSLDLHSNVKEAVGIADVSSAVCLEISASGEASVVESSAAAIAVDLAALEVLLTASNVDLDALETLVTAGNVDIAALEVLLTASNVDLAAMEALLITIDADTGDCATDLAALEVLITASNVDLDAIETLITAGNVDLAAIEVLITDGNVDLAAIEVLNTAIQTAVETVPAKTGTVAAADAQVKASAGTVYAVLVSGIGVTAADKIEIKNSTDNAGDALITIVADAANGTWAFYPCVGITYDTGIYCDETKSGGTFTVTIVSE